MMEQEIIKIRKPTLTLDDIRRKQNDELENAITQIEKIKLLIDSRSADQKNYQKNSKYYQ